MTAGMVESASSVGERVSLHVLHVYSNSEELSMCVLGLEICILPVLWHIRKTNTCAACTYCEMFSLVNHFISSVRLVYVSQD